MLLSSFAMRSVAQTPTLLRDINTDEPRNSTPSELAKMGNFVYFSATDGLHGRELWKTDGTEAGTEMVQDINFGTDDSEPQGFCNVNGTVFFTATTPQRGRELWKTDGTPAGTALVTDLIAGAVGSEPQNLTSCNGKLFFTADLPEGVKLFVSDGTAAGTAQIIPPGLNLFAPRNLLSADGKLFFTASQGILGEELWQTDGTAAGTIMVRNLNPADFLGSHPKHLCTDGLNLYFSADDGSAFGRQLWRYNFNTQAMFRRTSIQLQGGNSFGQIIWHPNNVVFFTAASLVPGPGYELWRLDSAVPNGATKINGTSQVGNLKVLGTKVCFTQKLEAGPKLSSAGTSGNLSTLLKTFSLIPGEEYPSLEGFVVANGKLFFTAATADKGRELWKTDGTAAGTSIVADYMPGPDDSEFSNLCSHSGKVIFGCKGPDGNELRSSDGAVINTVRNIWQAGSASSGFTKMDNTTYFAATNNNTFGPILWKTDGTTAGTVPVANFESKNAAPSNFLVVPAAGAAKTLFFVAHEDEHGRELYKLENTAGALPVRISDIVEGASSNIGNLTNVGGTLYFTATNNVPGQGDRIYRVNAARTGVEIVGGLMQYADNLVAKGSTLFFTQAPQGGDPMLCKMVGGATSIVKIFPLIPAQFSPVPRYLTVVGNYLYFSAADAAKGRELWRTNAAATDAVRISDIMPGAANSNIGNLTNLNGVLHFTSGTDAPNLGDQIFKVNANLTEVVATGGIMTHADDLMAAGNRLYFFQTLQNPGGVQLCKMENGVTTPLKFFAFLTSGTPLFPCRMTVAGSNVYFIAATPEHGRELWRSNGTEAGTVLLKDIRGGVIGSNILEMRLAGTDVYLSANNLANGQEPWRIANANALLEPEEGEERTETPTTANVASIKVLPNPASDFVQVTLPGGTTSGVLSLVSAAGQTLRSIQISESETGIQMNVQDLPKGLYMLHWVQSDGQVLVQKLVVQ
jgi:ELWxxDGT repeat protein